jgi:hypothetical protein
VKYVILANMMRRCDRFTANKRRRVTQLTTLLVLSSFEFSVQAQTRPEIAVRIEATQRVYVVGDYLRIRVELTNSGSRDLLVARNLTGVGSNPGDITFTMYDSVGRTMPSQGVAVDCFMTRNPDSLAIAVMKRWIALSPRSSYITMVDFMPSPHVVAPGRYRIVAVYESRGIKEQYWTDCLKATAEEIAKLPFPAWEGKTESNSIWVEIAKPIASKRPG